MKFFNQRRHRPRRFDAGIRHAVRICQFERAAMRPVCRGPSAWISFSRTGGGDAVGSLPLNARASAARFQVEMELFERPTEMSWDNPVAGADRRP